MYGFNLIIHSHIMNIILDLETKNIKRLILNMKLKFT